MKIKSKKSFWDKFPDNVYKRNLDTMKLLVSWDNFQSNIVKIRNKSDIPTEGFKNNQEIEKWWDRLGEKSDNFFTTNDYLAKRKKLLYLKKRSYGEFLKEQEWINSEIPINKFHKRVDEIIQKYKLPYNFRDFIEKYILCNKISAPSTNFALSFNFGPERKLELETGKDWKDQIRWISLITYARLTEREIRLATKELRDHQKHYLSPTLTQDIRVHTDIDKAIAIEKKMDKRIRKTEEKSTNGYLEEVKKKYGEKKYKETVKLWREQGLKPTKKEVIRITSKEIAKEFFGSTLKANLVRQIYSRVKKERFKRFGKVM